MTLTTGRDAKIPSHFTNLPVKTLAAMSVPAFVGQVTNAGAAVGSGMTEPVPDARVAVANPDLV